MHESMDATPTPKPTQAVPAKNGKNAKPFVAFYDETPQKASNAKAIAIGAAVIGGALMAVGYFTHKSEEPKIAKTTPVANQTAPPK